MSYHNNPYRVDYLKIYPCLKERPDVLEVLKKSDRKMKYMEVDLKSEQRRKNAENGAESYVPSKEDSLERLVYANRCFRASAPIRTGRFPFSGRCIQPAPFLNGDFSDWQRYFSQKNSQGILKQSLKTF